MDGTDPTTNETAAKPRWTQLAALGLFMIGLAAFLMVAASLIWGLDGAGDLTFIL